MYDFSTTVPEWLHNVFLGYGSPNAASYFKLPKQLSTLTFFDTFLDEQHVKESFVGTAQLSSTLIPSIPLSYHCLLFAM